MSNVEALKEQARRHEQKEEWQKACDQYMLAIEKLDDEEQIDIGLYNRVGDLLIRVGDFEKAVEHFDKAADLYVESELPNNAIAICKKVIRHLPNRYAAYLRMGRIRASQGFLLDARDNFLTYAERIQSAGDTEEALRSLVEFAGLSPEDTPIRMAVSELLIKNEQPDEALEQLAAGYSVLVNNGDEEGAAAFQEKILELDPDADLDSMVQEAPTAADYAFNMGVDEPDEDVFGNFGEIAVPGADDQDEDDDGSADTLDGAESDEGEDDEAEIGGFAEISLGGDDGEAADDSDEDASVAAESDLEASDDDEDGGDFGSFSLGGDEEVFDDEGEDLPFMSFGEEDEDDDVEDLPFISDGSDDDADVGGASDGESGSHDDPADDVVEVVAGDFEDALEGALEDARDEADEDEVDLPFLSGTEGEGSSEDGDSETEDWAAELGADDDADSGFALDAVEGAADDTAAAEEAAGPRDIWAALLSRSQGDSGNVELAQELVELAFKLDDQAALVTSYLVLAEAFAGSGEAGRAQGVYQQVLSLDPDNTVAREALDAPDPEPAPESDDSGGGDYVDLGSLIFDDDDEEKTTRFQVAYEEPTGDEDADFARMLSQFKAKVAENFDHSDVTAHHDLGTAYKEMGLLDEAVEKFQEALRASPVHLPTYELLGQTFMDKGENAAAVRVLERALKVPHDVEDELIGIYYYLARAHEETGNTGSAVEFYDRVFSLDINFADVTERLRRLRPS